MTTKLTKLGTPENMGAFGELFTLVYNNGTQQSAILMPKIKGLSEKAQNQIYGRFYQASHPLEKNPAKGRELLAKNGDFIGLAGKFLEVKTDIELSAKIYKLFQENASIKTILSSYKKLSSASRKEIEEHLGMTAAEAAPKALEAALVKVFDGMGAYTDLKQAQMLADSAKNLASHFLKDYKILEQNVDFLKSKDGNFEEEKRKILEIFDSLSPCAQLIVEQKYVQHYSSRFAPQKTKLDTMRASLVDASPCFSKHSMLELLDNFNTGVVAFTILGTENQTQVGKIERLLMETYLSLPRYLGRDFLKIKAGGSIEALEQFISENMNVNPHTLKEFEGLHSEIEKQKTQHLKQFAAENPDAMKNVNPDHFSEVLKQFLIKNDLFIKKDFIDKVVDPAQERDEILQKS